jgi:hypothetical protein
MKTGRWLRCSSVTYRFRYAPSSRLAGARLESKDLTYNNAKGLTAASTPIGDGEGCDNSQAPRDTDVLCLFIFRN